MAHEYPSADLDSAQFHLKCGVNMLLAIHAAMEEGCSCADDYVDALYAAYNYFDGVCKEISDCVDACFAQKREART